MEEKAKLIKMFKWAIRKFFPKVVPIELKLYCEKWFLYFNIICCIIEM